MPGAPGGPPPTSGCYPLSYSGCFPHAQPHHLPGVQQFASVLTLRLDRVRTRPHSHVLNLGLPSLRPSCCKSGSHRSLSRAPLVCWKYTCAYRFIVEDADKELHGAGSRRVPGWELCLAP